MADRLITIVLIVTGLAIGAWMIATCTYIVRAEGGDGGRGTEDGETPPPAPSSVPRPPSPPCEEYFITGYVRGAHSGSTADGTSVWTREPIAAASWNVPMGARVEVAGVGTFRVADRGGGLGERHVDILVDTAAEAYLLTGYRTVCVLS